jgi:molybdopterin converting factor small subunit
MITIRLFGMTKVLAGNQAALSLALGDGNRVKDVVNLLNRLHPPIGELLKKKKVLVSVNQEIAHDDLIIKDGDEVALLPPFAGGCERKWDRSRKWSDT